MLRIHICLPKYPEPPQLQFHFTQIFSSFTKAKKKRRSGAVCTRLLKKPQLPSLPFQIPSSGLKMLARKSKDSFLSCGRFYTKHFKFNTPNQLKNLDSKKYTGAFKFLARDSNVYTYPLAMQWRVKTFFFLNREEAKTLKSFGLSSIYKALNENLKPRESTCPF